jgi:predicted transcriptional regulator
MVVVEGVAPAEKSGSARPPAEVNVRAAIRNVSFAMTDYNKDKVDEVVLALLYLNAFSDHYATRAWKSFDWDTMDRLYEKGYIDDPKSKAKSVILTEEGLQLAEELFEKHFGSTLE